jgi:hypothetical protein
MAKKKDLKDQNPKFTIDLIEILAEKDPTATNKYLPFMIKQAETWVDWLKEELGNNTFKEMFDIVKEFEELSAKNLLENKDIYSYTSNSEIVETIKLAREKVTKSQVKKFETVTLHEDDRWLVIQPLTSRSSNMYGKSTKWCVASESNDFKKYFNQYTENGVLVYVIDKSIKEEQTRDSLYSKVAFHHDKTKTGQSATTIWDTKDSQVSAVGMMEIMGIIPQEVMATVNKALKDKTNRELAREKGIKDDTAPKF